MSSSGGSGQSGKESCSFCGKQAHEASRLIAGPPGLYICADCVDLCHVIIHPDPQQGDESIETAPRTLDEVPSPRELYDELQRYVIGQEEAKRTLSVAVHLHYRRLVHLDAIAAREKADEDEVQIEKSNILMIGPTGSGKTLMAKTLARVLDVPLAIGDATTLTEAGYVGEDVENLLLKLVMAADYDMAKAERGIIFIDETDKVGKATQNVSITRDVSGEGVQQALLKILEGTVANIPPQGGRKHPEQQYLQLDTTNILFICGGAFEGLPEVVAERLNARKVGFRHGEEKKGVAELPDIEDPNERAMLYSKVQVQDLIKFGMIPEFVGRLPVLTALQPLDEEDLVKVLTEPRNALVRQYQQFFHMEGGELEFTPGALRQIARLARERGTGARGLRSVVEDLMRDILFEISEDSIRGKKTIIDESLVAALENDSLAAAPKTEDLSTDAAIDLSADQDDDESSPAGDTAAYRIN
ncbi:MAG: ATP-dependent protease ATP-binding subunit ClpX [Planctomycetia bacterium TMED53]|nr:MAG: ATP-dependent protease ATP-binding subunit ClpX [Planctomycetia bacterium TMED53]